MPISRREFVPLPFAERRHTPDTSRLASMYLRGGEILADLSLKKGEIAARTMGTLQQLFSNYQETGRRQKAIEAEAAIRKAEREAERAEREAERKARADERRFEQDRGAARYAADTTAPGPISPVLAEALRRFPETAGRLRDTTTLPARAMPGTAPINPEPETFTALEPNADQLERSAERLTREKAAAAAAAATRADDERANRQVAELMRHNRAMESISRLNAEARPDNTQLFVIRGGLVVPITKGQAQPGDVPYSAEAMQGMGGEASDARAMRTAAALNSIDMLKKMAPKRTPGPMGMLEGAAQTMKGYAGFNSDVRQFSALIQPTAMQMAVAIQGAAGLSNAEREAMAKMLGSINTMDYEAQMGLLDKASQMIRTGADVTRVTVKDPETGQPVQMWAPRRSRMPGAVTIGQPGAATGGYQPGSDPAGLFPATRPPGGAR